MQNRNQHLNRSSYPGGATMIQMGYVPRQIQNFQNQVEPLGRNRSYPVTTNRNRIKPGDFQSVSPNYFAMDTMNAEADNTSNRTIRTLFNDSSSVPPQRNNLTLSKPSVGQRFTGWLKGLSSSEKILFGIVVTIAAASLLTVAIIPPVYVLVISRTPDSQSSFTNLTVSACATTTCIGKETPYRTSMTTNLYSFDGNLNDQTGYYTATSFGSSLPGYTAGGYVSQAIQLSASSQQYVLIPGIDLTKKSFTLQTWLYTGNLNATNSFGIFSQCDASSVCLSLILLGARVTLSFDAMNTGTKVLTGSNFINSYGWLHLSVVYDATLFQQQIYVDGKIYALSSGIVNSFQGNSSSLNTTIGRSLSSSTGTTYYNGKIDQFVISSGSVRSACQISNDASLIVYYPFDTTGTYNDYGFNICNGMGYSTTSISSGRVNQAISFKLTTSYFQAQCYPQLRGADPSFSFSLWINPTSVSGGTLLHLSAYSFANGSCYDPLVFTNTGVLLTQWMTNLSSNALSFQGPTISTNTWTHITALYSSTNGVRLFVNGQFIASSSLTANITLFDTTTPFYITLGNRSPTGTSSSTNCQNSGSAQSGSYSGSMDEFRMYNRELDGEEICVLSNP